MVTPGEVWNKAGYNNQAAKLEAAIDKELRDISPKPGNKYQALSFEIKSKEYSDIVVQYIYLKYKASGWYVTKDQITGNFRLTFVLSGEDVYLGEQRAKGEKVCCNDQWRSNCRG